MPQASDFDSRAEHLHLAFLASPASVRDNLRHMLTLPPLASLTQDGRGVAELVLAEVLNNVTEHAYADRPGPVSVTMCRGPKGISCLVVDQGKAMPGDCLPPGRLPDGPDTALDDLPEGGWGWHLIRTLTLDLGYARDEGSNRLSFTLPLVG